MIWKGFRFGMILQFAIGPMCMFVFQTSVAHGFFAGELGVLGTALVDLTEIVLAIVGIGVLLEKSRTVERGLKLFGVAILLVYGVVSILGALNISLLPGLSLNAPQGLRSPFFRAVLLALSDPLTIVFWAGVFSARIAQDHLSQSQLRCFAGGCVLSTIFFLSLVSVLGSVGGQMVPAIAVRVLNGLVGIFLIYFAWRNWKAPESHTEKTGTA